MPLERLNGSIKTEKCLMKRVAKRANFERGIVSVSNWITLREKGGTVQIYSLLLAINRAVLKKGNSPNTGLD